MTVAGAAIALKVQFKENKPKNTLGPFYIACEVLVLPVVTIAEAIEFTL